MAINPVVLGDGEMIPQELHDVVHEFWQTRIREAEADIEAGRTRTATSKNLDDAFEWLDGRTQDEQIKIMDDFPNRPTG